MAEMEIVELNYCWNCMAKMEPGETVCPVCGFDNASFQNPEQSLPVGTILAGRYLTGRIRAKAGYGNTYLGIDLALGMRVLIREYCPLGVAERDPDSLRVSPVSPDEAEIFREECGRWEAEARQQAEIGLPNVCQILNLFRENGTLYVIKIFFNEGELLDEELQKSGGRMSWQRTIELFAPLIQDLEKLHQNQLIHGDINPNNLLVVKESSGKEHLVLLNFGDFSGVMIIPGYSPIEQYGMNKPQGPFTDVYSLCASMYKAITGSRPAAVTDLITKTADIPSFSDLGISVPARIENAIFHGLAVRSEERTQTMQQLYDELCGEMFSDEEEDPGQDPAVEETPGVKRSTTIDLTGQQVPAQDYEEDYEENYEEDFEQDPEQTPKPGLKIWLFILLVILLGGTGLFLYWNNLKTQESVNQTRTAVFLPEIQSTSVQTQAVNETAGPLDPISIRYTEIAETESASNGPVPTNTPQPTSGAPLDPISIKYTEIAETQLAPKEPAPTSTPQPAIGAPLDPISIKYTEIAETQLASDQPAPADTPQPTSGAPLDPISIKYTEIAATQLAGN